MKNLIRSIIFGTVVVGSSITGAWATDAITTANLNFRAGPGTNYALRGSIPAGQTVTVRTCSDNWCQINYGPRTGWASVNYLAFATGQETYNSYNNYASPSPSFNVIIDGGYWDNDYYWNHPHRPPHWNSHRPPPPHWGNGHPPRPPHPGWRPPLPGSGVRPPEIGRPPHWTSGHPERPGPTMRPPSEGHSGMRPNGRPAGNYPPTGYHPGHGGR